MATSNWRGIDNKVTESLSEAKDNVKYLQTLEKFLEPLYVGNPESIKETLPALMNSIKMIHTIARYYNTTERMTGLFVKITNQMITNCKFNIVNFRNIKLGLNINAINTRKYDATQRNERLMMQRRNRTLSSCCRPLKQNMQTASQ